MTDVAAPTRNRQATRPLKVGYWLPETAHRRGPSVARWSELRDLARHAEAVGFDSLWAADRLLFVDEGRAPYGGWECWSLLAALAAATTRVELVPFVTNGGFRNPALVAKMADTIDEISGGRFVLAIGAGDGGPDGSRFGVPIDHRVSRFEEAIYIIYSLLHEGRVDVEGRYHSARDCELRPRGPRPHGPPIVIGSFAKERMIRLTANYADMWNVSRYQRPEDVAALRQRFDAACQAIGRDPETLSGSVAVPVDLPVPREHAPSTAYGFDRSSIQGFAGTPAEIAEELRSYARAGAAHVVIWLNQDTPAAIEAFAPVLEALDTVRDA